MTLALSRRTKSAMYLATSFLGVAISAIAGAKFASNVPGIVILYLPSVLFAAWYAGRGPGLLIIGVSVVAWLWVGIPNVSTLIDGIVHFTLFTVVVLSISAYRNYYLLEKERAVTDPLTGILDRRGFRERAAEELARARRYKHPLSVAYIDVDNFKEINDMYGHAGGDKVLHTIAASLQHSTREIDAVARLGGDEFGVLFPETGSEVAQAAIRGLISRVNEDLKTFEKRITISIGSVTFETPGSVEEMLDAADRVMYQVKRRGKNEALHFSENKHA